MGSKNEKEFFLDGVEIRVPNREKINVSDKRFEECLEVIAGWRTNLYKLYELDSNFRLVVVFPTDSYLKKLSGFEVGSDEYEGLFCDIVEEIILSKMKEEKIDLDKLHYGLEVVQGITYEYSHITNEEHQKLLDDFSLNWYKITCVVPYPQVHKDVFYVPSNKLHDFFKNKVYETYNGTNREIIDIQCISAEQAETELQAIKKIIEHHEETGYKFELE